MKVFLVGGAVRDLMMGHEPKDRDFVVVGSTPEEMLARGFKQVGADFPVFLHPDTGEEYALARQERKTGPGYHGFETRFNPDVTLTDDLHRRDLTINAMAMDLETNELFDPFSGMVDLKSKTLRHVSRAFSEDPVRVLRVARFVARTGFLVAHDTEELMRELVENGELDHLTAERVWAETEKALMEWQPDLFFCVLWKCGALNVLFPGLPPTQSDSLLRAAAQGQDAENRFAALVMNMDGGFAEELMDNLKVPVSFKKRARKMRRLMDEFNQVSHAKLRILKDLDALRDPEAFETLAASVVMFDDQGLWAFARELAAAHRAAMQVTFDDLTPVQRDTLKGPEISRAMDELRRQRML